MLFIPAIHQMLKSLKKKLENTKLLGILAQSYDDLNKKCPIWGHCVRML